MALRFHWSLVELMWIYWCQSVIVGAINFFKLLSLQDYSTEGYTMNGRKVPANQATKLSTAVFFAFHYGGFHFVYMIFLLVFSLEETSSLFGGGVISLPGIIFSALIFLCNHLYSYITNWPQEKAGANIGSQMFIPYLRIFPMHLTIIFGAILSSNLGSPYYALLLFLVLKTASDIGLHLYEHRRVVQT